MPVKACWYWEEKVIYLRQWGVVTLEDVIETDQSIGQYAASVDHIIHGILDTRDLEEFQVDPKKMQAYFAQAPKPTQGWIVTLHGDRLSAFMTKIMSENQDMRQKSFPNLEEAVIFLREVDTALENLPTLSMEELLEHL